MSTTTVTYPAVFRAIAAVLRDIGEEGISKDRKNQQQNYNFRGIDDAMNALNPKFAKHQLVILPHYRTRTVTERESKGGASLMCVVVEGTFDLVSAEDGSMVTVGPFWGESFDSGDKASNKAQSAALKYALLQTFLVPVEVEDADSETHEVAHKAPAPAPKPAPKTDAAKPSAAPPAPSSSGKKDVISEKQRARLYAIAKAAGWSDDDMKQALKSRFGFEHSRDIPWRQYDDIVKWFDTGGGIDEERAQEHEAPAPDDDTPF